ncbi:MAG TPA: RDD family protein [Ramlibacter sp.]
MTQADSSRDARYAPPAAHVEDVAADQGPLQLATRSQRFWAAMIDLGVLLAVVFGAAALVGWEPWNDADASNWTPKPRDAAVNFLIFLAVQGVLLARRGQTVGKAALGIRIARPDGAPASVARLIGVRYGVGYLLMVVPGLGQLYGAVDALLIFRPSRRCLHDLLADTAVFRA